MLIELISTISIFVWDFNYCDKANWMYYHWIAILPDNTKIETQRKIEICKTWDKEQMKFTLIHELWHYFWYEYMTEEERKNYKKLFYTTKYNEFYRENSYSDVSEDFADMFALSYIWSWINTKIFNLKLEYIKSIKKRTKIN